MKRTLLSSAAVIAAAAALLPVAASAAPAPPVVIGVQPPMSLNRYAGTGADAVQKTIVKDASGCRFVRETFASVGPGMVPNSVSVTVSLVSRNRCTGKVSYLMGTARAASYGFDQKLSQTSATARVTLQRAIVADPLVDLSTLAAASKTVNVNLRWNGTGGRDRTFMSGSWADPCTGTTTSYFDKFVSRSATVSGSIDVVGGANRLLGGSGTRGSIWKSSGRSVTSFGPAGAAATDTCIAMPTIG